MSYVFWEVYYLAQLFPCNKFAVLNVRVFDLASSREAKEYTVHSLMRWGKALKQTSQIGAAWRQTALSYKRQHARTPSMQIT